MVPKFRAWDEIQHKMLQVDYIEFIDGKAYWVEASSADDNPQGGNDGPVRDNSQLKLEQYTGLKDVNGKEIYEGDVVHFRSDCLSGLGVVRWNGACGAWEVEDIRSRTNKRGHRIYPIYPQAKYRIDGNVHENPELLEGK